MKSKLISISAISAGFVAIFLLIGAYVEVADIFTIIIASIFVTLPLYYKSFKACFLAFLAGGVIAFICSGLNIYSLIFPSYFGFFGIYPIIKFICIEKNLNKIVRFIIGIVWCMVAFIGIYFYYITIEPSVLNGFPEWISEYMVIAVAIIGAVFYLIYDKYLSVCRRISDYYLKKIIK